MRWATAFLAGILLVSLIPNASASTPTPTNQLVTHRINQNSTGLPGGFGNFSISADGDSIAFEYTPGGSDIPVSGYVDHTSGGPSVFYYNATNQLLTLVSHKNGTTGDTGNSASQYPLLSADGRYIVYQSNATDLLSTWTDDPNAYQNLFVYDTSTGTNRLVSHKAGDETAEPDASTLNYGWTAISSDGGKIAYRSEASNIVQPFTKQDGTNESDVYLYDNATHTNEVVSHDSADATSGQNDAQDLTSSQELPLSISADGRFLAFTSKATNLVNGFTAGTGGDEIYLYDDNTKASTLVTHDALSKTMGSDGTNQRPKLSANGARIAFETTATNLVSGFHDNDGTRTDVFVWSRSSNSNRLVSFSATGGKKEGSDTGGFNGSVPFISDNGKVIAYESDSDDLMKGFTDRNAGQDDIYVWTQSKKNGKTVYRNKLVAFEAGDPKEGEFFGIPNLWGLGGDGKHVLFNTNDTNIITGFTDGNTSGYDVYVFDRSKNASVLVSRSLNNPTTSANGGSSEYDSPRLLSTNGTAVVYYSSATDIVASFTNNNGAVADLYRFGP